MISSLAEGLYIAYEIYGMAQLEVRVEGIERELEEVKQKLRSVEEEMDNAKRTVSQLSNYTFKYLLDQAISLLGRYGVANSKDARALSFLVASLGTTISAITFKGKKKNGFKDGILTYRGFVAGTQSIERIFSTIEKLSQLSTITGGRIETTCVSSPNDMVAAGVAVASFFKVAEIFNLDVSALTDKSSDSQGVLLRFEGKHSLKEYSAISFFDQERASIIRGARKNVYILGTNGVGKSSWGNVITGNTIFEVGTSDHTTMIPQSCDIDTGLGFRLWDTPGLFDGTEDATLMEEHMNSVIHVNAFFSGVLFVFSGAVPANDITHRTLDYAIEIFGETVKKQFVAVINDMVPGLGKGRRGSYVEMLRERGFQVTNSNIYVESAINDGGTGAILQTHFSKLEPVLVNKYQKKYDRIINREGGLDKAVKEAYACSREEMRELLRRGKIQVLWYRPDGPNPTVSIPKNIIIFRQNSKGYFSRKFGIGTNKVLEERRVQLNGSAMFQATIRAQLNQEYQWGQVGIFLSTILSNPRHILIHNPDGKYDYELLDGTNLTAEEMRNRIIGIVTKD